MRQAKKKGQQEKLEDLIRDLERDLSEGKSQVAALEEAYKRLEESERLCRELASENRQLLTEVAALQERCAGREESERQVGALRRQLEVLEAEHAHAVARNREFEQVSCAQTSQAPLATETYSAVMTEITADPVRGARVVQSWFRQNRRVAMGLAGVLVLGLMAVLVVGRSEPARSQRPPTTFSDRGAPMENALEAVGKPAQQAAPRIRGVFQTTRPTRVYSEPSEESDRVADIGKGTRVHVVNAQNGWLEIHSKHGRPPGFIRRDTAERVASN